MTAAFTVLRAIKKNDLTVEWFMGLIKMMTAMQYQILDIHYINIQTFKIYILDTVTEIMTKHWLVSEQLRLLSNVTTMGHLDLDPLYGHFKMCMNCHVVSALDCNSFLHEHPHSSNNRIHEVPQLPLLISWRKHTASNTKWVQMQFTVQGSFWSQVYTWPWVSWSGWGNLMHEAPDDNQHIWGCTIINL